MNAHRLGELFDAHADRLYRLARRLVATPDDARDLVQETFLHAAKTPHDLPIEAEAWLIRVLVNIRRDQWRRQSVRMRHYDSLHVPPPQRHPEDALIDRATVWQALDTLPPRRRAIVVMHEIEGASVASIAALLGITAITVRWHLSRARRTLAQTLRFDKGDAHADADRTDQRRRSDPSRNALA